MTRVTHLKSLQALEMTVREGSLTAAAKRLGITPAAVGQRLRTLENYLGTDLLMRGRSGLIPAPDLDRAMPDLRAAFAALDRVTETLDFQRTAEIHIVSERDWSDLWMMPRLQRFREAYPHVLFCLDGMGDVPVRLGAPDIRVSSAGGPGEPLFREMFLPVSGPDNTRRIAGYDKDNTMEGMPILHVKSHSRTDGPPGWVRWFEAFGLRREGPDRGVRYDSTSNALEAVRQDVGFLVCGLSFVLDDIDAGRIELPFRTDMHLAAPHPYCMTVRQGAANHPQLARFLDFLRAEAAETERRMRQVVAASKSS